MLFRSGFEGGGNPLLLFVEGGGFVRTGEAEEPFLLRLFRLGVDELGEGHCEGGVVRGLPGKGEGNFVGGGRRGTPVVEDELCAIDGAGHGFQWQESCHPLFDLRVAQYLVAFERVPQTE